MSPWAKRRKFIVYILILAAILLFALSYLLGNLLKKPTCFDQKQNGDEIGIDCGGACTLACKTQFESAKISWSEAKEISGNIYNIGALVENTNREYDLEIQYTFNIFSTTGDLIWTQNGKTNLLPLEKKAIFEPHVYLGKNKVKDVFFEITETVGVKENIERKNPPVVVSQNYNIKNSIPTLNLSVLNESAQEFKKIKVIGVLYDEQGNIVHFSNTVINNLLPKEEQEAFMTWQKPFNRDVKTFDIFLHEVE